MEVQGIVSVRILSTVITSHVSWTPVKIILKWKETKLCDFFLTFVWKSMAVEYLHFKPETQQELPLKSFFWKT